MLSVNWDVNKYRNDFDTEEQWRIKRDFMLTYISRFSEDRLVCLAQVLFNVKYLGCKYPDETMSVIEELSKKVRHDFTEEELKPRIKRTLVEAQTAAAAKVQRKSYTDAVPSAIKEKPTEQPEKSPVDNKTEEINIEKPLIPSQPSKEHYSFLDQGGSCTKRDFTLLRKMQSCKGPISPLVIIKAGDEISFSVLLRISEIWNRPFTFIWEKINGNKYMMASVIFDGVELSKVFGQKKVSKRLACDIAVWKLQQCYYTAQMDRDNFMLNSYFKGRLTAERTDFKTYGLNMHLKPKMEKPENIESLPNFAVFMKLKQLEKLDEKNDYNEIIRVFKQLFDDYENDTTEVRELIFEPQFSFNLYEYLSGYVNKDKSRFLTSRFLGSGNNRLLNVRKLVAIRTVRQPWNVIQNLLIEGSHCIGRHNIAPPGTVRKPDYDPDATVEATGPRPYCND